MTASFVYDGDGNRVAQTIDGVTTFFIGSYYEFNDTTDKVTKYYYSGGQRVAMRKNGTLYYMFSDHLGSTSITTDSAGNVVSELRYKPWGETRYAGGNTPTQYTFTGQRDYTSDFGLMYFNARWVDVSTGRFAQADTVIPQGQGVQAWDRYAFVNNNPVRYIDPSGHMADDGDDGGCVGGLDCAIPPVNHPGNGGAIGNTNNCKTVDCRATHGDVISILDLVIPSHIGWRLQIEGTISIGFWSPSITLGFNGGANRKSDELGLFIDGAFEPAALGVGSPAGISITTGPLIGWGSSDLRDIAHGDSYVASGTIAPDLAISFAGSSPMEGDIVNSIVNEHTIPRLHEDPIYGQIPATLYAGVGAGAYYAGAGAGASRSLTSVIFKLP